MRNVVEAICVAVLFVMVCSSCFAASVNHVVTIVRFTQLNVMPDIPDSWYEEVANEVNAKFLEKGVQAESSKHTWEEYAKQHLHEKRNKQEVTQEWNEILRSKYDTKVDVFVDKYAKNFDGTADITVNIVMSSMKDGHILTDSMFTKQQMNMPRKEALQYAIKEAMVPIQQFLKK